MRVTAEFDIKFENIDDEKYILEKVRDLIRTGAQVLDAEAGTIVVSQIEEQVNVFEGMPAHGSVVATLSPEELTELLEISDELNSHRCAPLTLESMASYKKLSKRYREQWATISRNHGIPSPWTITYDDVTGKVYINNKD